MKTDGFFNGFPPDTIPFFRELRENNNRHWFAANKRRYQENVLFPAQAFVMALGSRLQQRFPGIQADPRTNGSGSIFRIYRDTRFSHDKTPYKTNLGIFFWHGGLPKSEAPGFYFHLDGDGIGLYAGVYEFSSPMLQRFRQAVADPILGASLVNAVAKIRAHEIYSIGGKHYKKMPRGFEAPEDRAEFLLYNTLYAFAEWPAGDFLCEPAFIDFCVEHFTHLHPLLDWLCQWMVADAEPIER